jgi:5-methylcytosine-specific restriction endonuclease McrA
VKFLKEPPGRHSWQRYYNRLKRAGGRITTAMKLAALDRANGRCEICGTLWHRVPLPKHRRTPVDFHHKRRIIDGGRTTARNVMAVCWRCNMSAHGKRKPRAEV